ncbi:hypothetical protein [Burkholderia diffusa]|uniref:hypothetical protein n=1 Tax=Burkholderia diffusa TaxID=488732 RepID=UPI0007541877|nr:hypothetical protein [Burkholderia diffusa]KVH45664.1 hypothetical protein WJ39_17805 [Burkholderia diffusa]
MNALPPRRWKRAATGLISLPRKLDFAAGFDDLRLVRWVVATVIVLSIVAGTVVWARIRVQRAYDDLAQQTAQMKETERQLAHVRLEVVRAGKAQTLLGDAATSGFTVDAWGVRRLSIVQENMSRTSLNELLAETVRSPGRLFGASEFDLVSRSADTGLFDVPQQGDKDVLVSMSGEMFFRTTGAK